MCLSLSLFLTVCVCVLARNNELGEYIPRVLAAGKVLRFWLIAELLIKETNSDA